MMLYLTLAILLVVGLLVPAVIHRLHPINFWLRALVALASVIVVSLVLGLVMSNPPADHGLSKYKGEELTFAKEDLNDTEYEVEHGGGSIEQGFPGETFLVVTEIRKSGAGCGYEARYDVYLIVGWLDPKVDEVRTECGNFDG